MAVESESFVFNQSVAGAKRFWTRIKHGFSEREFNAEAQRRKDARRTQIEAGGRPPN